MAYKDNCLKNVIFRVDFAEDFPIDESVLKEVCLSDSPIYEKENVKKHQVINFVNAEGIPSIQMSESGWTNHVFWDRQRTRRTVISPKYLFVDIHQYQTYRFSKSLFMRVFEVLKRNSETTAIKRIGMRYINEIDLTSFPQTSWKNYIGKQYIDASLLNYNQETFVSSKNEINLSFGDYGVRFIYGFLNPDNPARLKRNVFSIDLDAFIFGETKIEDVPQYLDTFHSSIETLFENVINAKQRVRMGVRSDE